MVGTIIKRILPLINTIRPDECIQNSMQGIIDFLAITFEKSLLYLKKKKGSAVACKRLPPPLEQNWGERRLSSRFCLRGGGGCTQTSSDFRFELRTQSFTHESLWDMAGTFNALISGSYPDVPCASSPVTRVSRSPLCKRRGQSIYSVRVHCTPEGLNFFSYIFAITYVVYI